MLQNAYLLAKIGADTAENEQHFAEILPKIGNYPTGSRWRPRAAPGAPRGLGPRTRRVVASFWQNFGKMLIVFGCIGTDFCK